MNLDTELITLLSEGKGSISKLEKLLRDGANPNVNNGTNTALMLAARWGWKSAVEMLLNFGANPNIVNSGGDTALVWAEGNPDVVKILEQVTDSAKFLSISAHS